MTLMDWKTEGHYLALIKLNFSVAKVFEWLNKEYPENGYDNMNISILLQSLSKLKSENIRSSTHFKIRFEERKDDVMPDIEGIHRMLIGSDPVAVSNQEGEKFEILFNLNEDYDLALVVSVKDTNPEIIIS